MKKILSILMLVMAIAVSANAADKVIVFNVSPAMSCENCENKIKTNLRHESGVKKIVTSLKDQTVAITYDATKTSPEAIEKGFEKIGYKASVAGTDTGNKVITGNACQMKSDKSCKQGGKCDKTSMKKCDKTRTEKCGTVQQKACCDAKAGSQTAEKAKK